MSSELVGLIAGLVDKRQVALDVDDDPLISRYAEEIYGLLKEHRNALPVDFILETLTGLGAAPSLLYDDNAHWTVGGDGHQNLIFDEDRDKETTFSATWIVKPNRWRKTIRDAIGDYFDDRE